MFRVNRRVLILLAALIVAVVVVGLVLANLGNGGGHHHPPAANGTSTHPTGTSSTPATPSACPLLATTTITKALRVPVAQGVVSGPAGSRECTWHAKGGGTVLTLSITNSGQDLELGLLGNHINGRVTGLGSFAVFASPPPRLAFDAGSGVLVTLGPDGYRGFLPKGSTNPRRISKAAVLPPLETLVKAAAAALK
jgi:hypothetical protein